MEANKISHDVEESSPLLTRPQALWYSTLLWNASVRMKVGYGTVAESPQKLTGYH